MYVSSPPRQSKVRLTPFPPCGENIRPLPCSSFSPKSQRLFRDPGSPIGESSDIKASAPPHTKRNRIDMRFLLGLYISFTRNFILYTGKKGSEYSYYLKYATPASKMPCTLLPGTFFEILSPIRSECPILPKILPSGLVIPSIADTEPLGFQSIS